MRCGVREDPFGGYNTQGGLDECRRMPAYCTLTACDHAHQPLITMTWFLGQAKLGRLLLADCWYRTTIRTGETQQPTMKPFIH